MIIVKRGYYYIDEVIGYCEKKKEYKYFLKTLNHLKSKDEKYISSNFFYDQLKEIKPHLTNLNNYFNIKYFNLFNSVQEKKLLEYFDYKIPKYCEKTRAIHLYNKEVVEYIKKGYIVNFLGFYKDIEGLRKKGIILLNYNRIIELKNRKNSKKKLFLGAYK